MPTLKPGHIFVTAEDAAAIRAAAASDPDCPILTDAQWERVKPFAHVGAPLLGGGAISSRRKDQVVPAP